MARDLNKHTCIGRLGQDPEVKYLPSGEAVTNISVACGESWKDKATGAKQERTTWIPYVAFGKLAEIMGEYLRKGSKVYLEGKLQVRKWKDKDGNDRYSTEIVCEQMQMLDGKQEGVNQQSNNSNQMQHGQTESQGFAADGRAFGTPDPQPQSAPQQITAGFGSDEFDDIPW